MIDASTVDKTINCWLRRHKDGILVHVKVSPAVEEFFQQWGGGIVEAPAHGRLWKSIDGGPIRLWSFEHRLNNGDSYDPFTLSGTGTGFMNDNGQVNLSFLRLVGASSPEGQSFVMEAVISRNEIERIAAKINKASEALYTGYIQDVNINVYVGTVDMSRAGVHG